MSVLSFRHDKRISDADRNALREYCSELGGNVVALANKLGLKVFEEELPHDQSGYIEYDPSCGSESGYKVVVNAKHPVERKQFTAAHEIGHFVLHRSSKHFREKEWQSAEIFNFPSGYRSPDSWDNEGCTDWMEREADVFAATVLLPPNPVRRSPEFINGEPVALAKRLGLSKTFVVRRFEELQFGV